MEIELAPAERFPNQQNCSDQTNVISQGSGRQYTFVNPRIQPKRSKIVLAKRWFFSCIRSKKMRVFVPALFTSVAIAIGVLVVCLTAPQPNTTCQRIFQRTMKGSLAYSSQPRFIAVGDFNNDDQIDLVVANSGHNTIGIFFSRGDGTFADQQTFPTGADSSPYSVAISDFNNDTHLDVAVANYAINSVGIFLGHGNGTFADQKVFSLGSSRPLFVATGDLNKDSRMDIVVVNYGTQSIGVLLGSGNGSFQDPTTYSTGYDSLPYSLVVADFNGDNQLDIAVTNHGTDNIGILLGLGNGTFAKQQIYTTLSRSNPSSLAVGDLNNDNRLDIVVANNGTGTVGIFFGHANGSFLPQTTVSTGDNSYPQHVVVGDVNKDNELDIIVVDSENDRVHVLPGSGNGNFVMIDTYDTVLGSGPFCVAVADFNNDNQSDIAVVDKDTSNVLILIGYATQSWLRQTNYYNGGLTGLVSVGDFNNDNIYDILVITEQVLSILTGLADGTFDYAKRINLDNYTSTPQYVCVGDLNNDNQADIVTANEQSNNVAVFLGHGDGTFFTMTTYSTGVRSTPAWIALGDVNNDNRLDIISANTGSNTIGILLGTGDGIFATVVTHSIIASSSPYSVTVADINTDNYLDLVVTVYWGDLIIFLGFGNGSFYAGQTYLTFLYTSVSSIALADFNNDNHLDIIVTYSDLDLIILFLGYGDGTFEEQPSFSIESNSHPHSVVVADFDHDNLSDIAAVNLGADTIVILYGNGETGFLSTLEYSTGYGSKPFSITTVNFDNNKGLAMIVNLQGTEHIAVLTPYDAATFVNETKYSTGSALQAVSIAAGDFNRDNRSDIVVANSGTDTLSVLLSSNNSSLVIQRIYPIGNDSDPQYVITCDIDKDNRLDMVSVNSKDDSISVIMGYGNGTFAEQLKYSMGDQSDPQAVASGDFNNDSRLDLAIVNKGTDNIGILFGFNYTNFQLQVAYLGSGASNPYSIVVNDFNNDSFLDIVAVFSGSGGIVVFLGRGDGTFDFLITYLNDEYLASKGIAVGDFNNDNQLDIVVTVSASNNIVVSLGYGNGSFGGVKRYSTEGNFYLEAIATGDLNNDGQLDIVVTTTFFITGVGVLLGYGNGSFATMQVYESAHGSHLASVTIGDFNHDGYLDVAVANNEIGNVGILIGYGNGTFQNQVTFANAIYSQPQYVTIGDFNGDDHLDIAIAYYNDDKVGVLLGYGNGSFADLLTYSAGAGSQPIYLDVGDFNNDSILDIAVANDGTRNIVVLFGYGDGSFLLGPPYQAGSRYAPYSLAIGDFNNDSRLDIATGNSVFEEIDVYLSNGSVLFGDLVLHELAGGSQPQSIAVGDLNHDGRSDVVVANYGTGDITVMLSLGNTGFDDIRLYLNSSSSNPYSVAIADFNSDHHLDIVVANSGSDNIAIFLGDGNRTFVLSTTYSTGAGSRPCTIITNDFNNDHIFDIAVTNSGTSDIFLLYGHGDGTFGNEIRYSLGYGHHPQSIVAVDLNGDGWLDIAIACYDTDTIEILMQICQY